MRIVFDVTSCAKPRRGGIATYGAELVAACARVAPEHEFALAVRSNRWFKRALVDDLLPGVRARLLVDGLHALFPGGRIDVLHGIGVRLPGPGRFAKVVTIHDLNVFEFPELSSDAWRRVRRKRLRETVARADRILSYSEQGAAALGEHLGVPREKVRVVPLGVDTTRFHRPPEETLAAVRARHGLTGVPYVLMVGIADGRKNHRGLLEAFVRAALPAPWCLVLGGPRGEAAGALAARARELGLAEERLKLPGWVHDDELPALLAGAAFYCCASLHEGFGLPVIEAQACGTPVACSNRAALLETLGDCGLAFDPEDPDAFAEALLRLAGDEALRADLSARGPARVAEHYSWERVARDTLAVYADAAAARG